MSLPRSMIDGIASVLDLWELSILDNAFRGVCEVCTYHVVNPCDRKLSHHTVIAETERGDEADGICNSG